MSTRLQDDRDVMLRSLIPDDREQLLNMFASLSREALKWSNPPYDEEKIDRWLSGTKNGLSIVALFKDQIVGIAAVHQFRRPREQGIGGMMIYIHQDFQGVGLGTRMTKNLLVLAKNKGLHRVSLQVVEENEVAIGLYKKLKFEIEGTLKDAYYGADEKYHNQIVMGILLSED